MRNVSTPGPRPGEILVRVHASSVSRTDLGYLQAHPFFIRLFSGIRRPRHPIRGMDFAGVVQSTGPEVASFKPGDRVFGLAPNDSGGHGEYLCVPESGPVTSIPDGIDFSEAAVCEGALYAYSNIGAMNPKPGQTMLIYGAAGAIGTAAVQLARYYGVEVTAVVATRQIELARSLGADHVVDYTAEDFTRLGKTFDFVFDAVGKTSYLQCRKLLAPRGVYSVTDIGPWASNVLLAGWSNIRRNRRVVFPLPTHRNEFVEFLRARMEAGDFRGVIDRHYPLEQIQNAYAYVLTGHKTGIVVLDLAPTAAAGEAGDAVGRSQ